MKYELDSIDESVVTLDLYNSDLNLVIDGSKYSAQPLTKEGFAFMWAGARATHGVTKGKFCFEVKVIEHLDVSHLPADEPNPHVVRVGFSVDSSTMQLGEDPLSYGYGGTGKISTNCRFQDFGPPFMAGDCILAVANMDSDPIQIGYAKNGSFIGWAYKVRKSELKDKALFPHVLTKNCSFEVNFGQLTEPYFKLPDSVKDFTFVGCLHADQRVGGTRPPEKREDCEMIMMCGLPGAGKSVWAADYSLKNPDKKYNVLGTNNIIDKMKVMGLPRKRNYRGRWDVLIQMATKCLNSMFAIGSKLRRNYILDQTNVYPTAQRRKMRNFDGFKRKAIVVVPTEAEYKRRCDKRDREEGKEIPDSAILEMKANFKLPEVCDIFDEVVFTELQRDEAEKLVKVYNEEGKSAMGPARKQFRPNESENKGFDKRKGNFGYNRNDMPDSRGGMRGNFGGNFQNDQDMRGSGGFAGGRGRGGFNSGRGGYDSGYGSQGGYDSGYGSQGGYDSGYSSQAGYGDRGSYESRGGGREGFGGMQSGYDNNRGGGRGDYDGNRGGGRGGYDGGRGGGRGGYDGGRGGGRGSYDGGRGGGRGGYEGSRGGGRGGYDGSRGGGRGGFDGNRGSERGAYDGSRGGGRAGYNGNRGGGRGGYDSRGGGRGGYDSSLGGRGGYDSARETRDDYGTARGGYDSSRDNYGSARGDSYDNRSESYYGSSGRESAAGSYSSGYGSDRRYDAGNRSGQASDMYGSGYGNDSVSGGTRQSGYSYSDYGTDASTEKVSDQGYGSTSVRGSSNARGYQQGGRGTAARGGSRGALAATPSDSYSRDSYSSSYGTGSATDAASGYSSRSYGYGSGGYAETTDSYATQSSYTSGSTKSDPPQRYGASSVDAGNKYSQGSGYTGAETTTPTTRTTRWSAEVPQTASASADTYSSQRSQGYNYPKSDQPATGYQDKQAYGYQQSSAVNTASQPWMGSTSGSTTTPAYGTAQSQWMQYGQQVPNQYYSQ